MSAVRWSDEVDGIIAGDLTAGLAYVTPAGGAVVTAVAPIGLRDREAGTVGFTTSLGLGRKLERIRKDPKVALIYHSRAHGFSSSPRVVLAQGTAVSIFKPDIDYLATVLTPVVVRYLGPPKRGRLFWDRWLREYYQDRVVVNIEVARVLVWPDATCSGPLEILGEPLPLPAPAQKAPRSGTSPRVDSERVGRRIGALPHRLIAFRAADGYPLVLPIEVRGCAAAGVELQRPGGEPLPAGGRRASVLGHRYNPHLIGLKTRQSTGWLMAEDGSEVAILAPFTDKGYTAPANKTLLLLLNGLVAKVGLAQARRAGRADLLDREPAR